MPFTSELRQTILEHRCQVCFRRASTCRIGFLHPCCQGECTPPSPSTLHDINRGFVILSTWTRRDVDDVLEVWRCQQLPHSASPALTEASRHAVKTAIASQLHFSPLNRWLRGVDGLHSAIVTTSYPCIEAHHAGLAADGFEPHTFPTYIDDNGIAYQLTMHRKETHIELDQALSQPVIVDKRQAKTAVIASPPLLSRLSSSTLARGSFGTTSLPVPSNPCAIPQPSSPDPRRRVDALQRAASWRSTLRNGGRSKLGCFPPVEDDNDDHGDNGDNDDSEALEKELAQTPPHMTLSRSLQSLISPPSSTISSTLSNLSFASRLRSPTSFRANLEESLLGNAIPSSIPWTVTGFNIKITTSSTALNPAPVKLPIAAKYYHLSDQPHRFNPYVASLDLNVELPAAGKGKKGRLRVPKHGQLQIVVFNPEQTGVKVFVVPYNLSSIQPLERTRIRQRTHIVQPDQSTSLLYSLHLQLQTGRNGRLYLVDVIKMVLASCPPHTDDRVETETMVLDPVATPPSGPRRSAKKTKPLLQLSPTPPCLDFDPKPIGVGGRFATARGLDSVSSSPPRVFSRTPPR